MTPHLADWAHVLCNQAVLTLGARTDEPAAFADQLNNLLVTLAVPLPAGQAETEIGADGYAPADL
jgi:molecular chaperone HtpG